MIPYVHRTSVNSHSRIWHRYFEHQPASRRGLKSNETALREAWEEAGVINSLATDKPIGSYIYKKTQANGFELDVETLVYSVAVKEISEHFPEEDQRQRKWVNAEAAVDLVGEVGLKSIIRQFKWLR